MQQKTNFCTEYGEYGDGCWTRMEYGDSDKVAGIAQSCHDCQCPLRSARRRPRPGLARPSEVLAKPFFTGILRRLSLSRALILLAVKVNLDSHHQLEHEANDASLHAVSCLYGWRVDCTLMTTQGERNKTIVCRRCSRTKDLCGYFGL